MIGCYLQMLEVAARHGPERRRSETPAEYLRRMLATTAAAAAPRPRSLDCSSGLATANDLSASRCGRTRSPRSTPSATSSSPELSVDALILGHFPHDGDLRQPSRSGIALGVGAPDPGAIERAAAGAFGLLGLGAGSIALSAAVEAGRPAGPRRRRPDEEPSDAGTAALVALERSLRFGASTAGDFYTQVRPRLVPLAKSCLARHGVALSDKERASRTARRRRLRARGPGLARRRRTVSNPASPSTRCVGSSTGSRRSGAAGDDARPTLPRHRSPPTTSPGSPGDVVAEVERAVVGKREAIELVLIGVLAGGHVLLEDVPGLAKTLIVRSLARVLGLETSRIQFTPDLMPADRHRFGSLRPTPR